MLVHSTVQTSVRYLEASELEDWDKLVEASPQGSLFCRSWWLKAIAPQSRILGYFEGSHLAAGIPVMWQRRFGLHICGMPKYNPSWGVVMEPLIGNRFEVASREIQIMKAIAGELAKQRMFYQSFHPSILNWLPFHWNGFTQTARVTYIIEDLSDLDRVWDGFSHSIKGEIRKATRLGLILEPCELGVVHEAARQSFQRQRLARPSTANLNAVYEVARENGAAQCFAVRDGEGRVHAANLLVWDSKAAYFLAGGADPKLRTSGATSFIIWGLIQFAALRTKSFDFEGSVIPSIERFFRSFGARQVPYNWVMKFPFWMYWALLLLGKP